MSSRDNSRTDANNGNALVKKEYLKSSASTNAAVPIELASAKEENKKVEAGEAGSSMMEGAVTQDDTKDQPMGDKEDNNNKRKAETDDNPAKSKRSKKGMNKNRFKDVVKVQGEQAPRFIGERNFLTLDTKRLLRKKKFNFQIASKVIPMIKSRKAEKEAANNSNPKPQTNQQSTSSTVADASQNAIPKSETQPQQETGSTSTVASVEPKTEAPVTTETKTETPTVNNNSNTEANTTCVPEHINQPPTKFEDDGIYTYVETRWKPGEKKQIDFRNKLYLAPLTTVGNLPFRRLCKRLGADITIGEMALALNLIKGEPNEWSLLRRHESEDVFGVQVAGNNFEMMAKCAELIQTQADVDFVDLNCGCPIDLICNKGMGSSLLDQKNKLGPIISAMDYVLDKPVTVKVRTGIQIGKNIVHKIFPSLQKWGASAITLHGRTKQQRYTKEADWDYISQCVKTVDVPVIGNGDILSYTEYWEHMENTGVATCMLGRGPLYKPWLFTEIKERRHWDISSTERLDILKDYARFGLDHWGSDDKGVESTRRFMLEWLSFTYRYIPVGLLEVVPQRMNQRPPAFVGRDDLETLMASPNCNDWLKLAELAIGKKAPDSFNFIPKHKSNSWDPEG